MSSIKLFGSTFPIPKTKEQFSESVGQIAQQHGSLRETALLFAMRCGTGTDSRCVASMVAEGKYLSLHLLFETLGRPDILSDGYCERALTPPELDAIWEFFTPYHEEKATHVNIAFLSAAREAKKEVFVTILAKDCKSVESRDAFLQLRSSLLFDLFNEGALRGSDALARQALLDSFGVLPNRFLSSAGTFLLAPSEEPTFIRNVANYLELQDHQTGIAGGIDKFPSLLSQRGEKLRATGNRIVPSVMIRDGVYVGNRNIFMFHAAVNIAAYIGDDNLIDSHASVGSAAQIGNKNKIASFVSLEGVLSPANAQGVVIGNDNFIGSFARIGTGITIGDKNFIASGVNLSLGTKLRDCRESSSTKGDYVTVRDFTSPLSNLAIAPNNATREFQGVSLLPGEYILFENSDEFMARFEGDTRIKAK